MPTAPAAPGGVVVLVPTGCAAPEVPEFPETLVMVCWGVVGLAAGMVVREVGLCEELFCTGVEVGVDEVPCFKEMSCVVVLGGAALEDGDIPWLAEVLLL